jgi:hypothetical protein
VKIFASYQIPVIELSLSGYWKYLSGSPYQANARVRGSQIGWTSSIYPNMEPLGTRLNDNQHQLDMRFEKVFNVGFHRFGVYADVSNLFNEAVVTGRVARYPSLSITDPSTAKSTSVNFMSPQYMNAGRQVTLGARWSF